MGAEAGAKARINRRGTAAGRRNVGISESPAVATVWRRMVTLKKDRKAKDCWLITTTDSEGLHRQLSITFDDMRELVRLWIDEVI